MITLTSRAARALPELAAIADSNDERFFGCLNATDRAALRGVLERLADIHQLVDPPLD